MEWAEILRRRTMAFAIAVARYRRKLPRNVEGDVLGRQLLKAATSAGANYRASCCGRSDGEWFSKLCIAREEADESEYWLSILTTLEIGDLVEGQRLQTEAAELTKLLSASIWTFKANRTIV